MWVQNGSTKLHSPSSPKQETPLSLRPLVSHLLQSERMSQASSLLWSAAYQFLQKRLVRLGFAPAVGFGKVQFTKLEEEIYGTPIYKQQWFKARRLARKV